MGGNDFIHIRPTAHTDSVIIEQGNHFVEIPARNMDELITALENSQSGVQKTIRVRD
jgi:hypothetical protein